MKGMNQETALAIMGKLIAGMTTKVGRECVLLLHACKEAEKEGGGEEVEADGEEEAERDGDADVEEVEADGVEEGADGEETAERDGDADVEEVEADGVEEEESDEEEYVNPQWIVAKGKSKSGYKGVTLDRGQWRCTVRGRTIARYDTKAEACDRVLEEWWRPPGILLID